MQRRHLMLLIAVAAAIASAAFLYSISTVGFLAAALIGAVLLGVLLASLSRGKVNPVLTRVPAVAEKPRLVDNVLKVTFDEIREAVVVVDSQLRVVAANPAARRLFTSLGENDTPRLTEITRKTAIYEAFTDATNGQERNGVKIEFYRDGPKTFDLRVVPLPSTRDAGTGAVGILFDVTKLDRLESVRQEFLSNVSHELRTPLTSIMALAETLAAGAVDDAENNRRFLAIIQKNSQRMQQLLNDILELSTIESGNVSVHLEDIPLASAVDDVINSLTAAAAARNVSVRNNVADKVKVSADPRRLIQMLTNLIDNAIKFNRENGTVTVTYDANRERDRIYVTDTGEGIPAQHLDRIFERFYRVDRARSRDLGGTGLGLAIVKHLARAHGGEVTATSRVGEGTEFMIELPHNSASSRTLV